MSITAAYIGIILIWSTTPLAIKWSDDGVGFLFGVTSRMLIGVLICGLILAFMRQKLQWHKRAVYTYLSASMGIFGSMLCTYWGAQYITSGMISVLFGLTPLLTSIFAALVLNERSLSAGKLVGISLGILGLVIIFHSDIAHSEKANAGIIAIIVAATLHSLSTVLVKKLDCGLPGIVMNTGSLMISSLLFLIVWSLSGVQMPETIPMKAGLSILYLGILGTVIGFTLFFYVLKNLDAGRIGLIPLITPVLALFIGNTMNNEPVGWTLIIGSLLIMTGLIAHHWSVFSGFWKKKSHLK